jgi:aryl-alcohol dehydrogenase-like predicted oxidoreductase
MRYRPLGSSGLRVSQLFLGAMTFADGFARTFGYHWKPACHYGYVTTERGL